MRGERGGHLRGLHPHAAQFDLVVEAPGQVQGAVGGEAAHVPGAVDAVGRVVAERVGGEAGSGGRVQVAAGQERRADDDLAGLARAAQRAAPVEHQQLGVGDGRADGQDGVGGVLGDLVAGLEDGALGGAVEVEDHSGEAGEAGAPAAYQGAGERFPGQAQQADGVQRGAAGAGGGVQPGGEHAGHGVDDGDGLLVEPGEQSLGVLEGAVRGRQAERGAAAQREEHVAQYGVEGERGDLRDAVVRPEAVPGLLPLDVVGERAVPAEDSLGAASGPGGEDDVRRVAGVHLGERGGPGRGQLGVAQHRPVQALGCVAGGDHAAGAGLRQQEPGAVGRLGRVQEQQDGAGAQHAEERGHRLEGAPAVHRDGLAGRDARRGQAGGDAVGAVGQLAVGPRASGAAHRGAVGCLGGEAFHPRGQRYGQGRREGAAACAVVGRAGAGAVSRPAWLLCGVMTASSSGSGAAGSAGSAPRGVEE
ncbi:hypothetical protein CF54_16550 [Streptomyces sp. Tu 6176]|nr:hypothetical protein [Streptomyces sp. Tu 6176]EYT81912.1 hypothetical protein CF54_16550 [Streptomyces sp. Tu 6176]